jgi:hypothetical protein
MAYQCLTAWLAPAEGFEHLSWGAAATQAEQEARSKARADARAQSGKGQEAVSPDAVNLEKGIKGLK